MSLTCEESVRFRLTCDDLVRFFSDVKKWYQIFTNVKNWYFIFTCISDIYLMNKETQQTLRVIESIQYDASFFSANNIYP